MARNCKVGHVEIGPGKPLGVIAGPCALESLEMGMRIGTTLRDACHALGLSYIFKASYDKANRTSVYSKRGPGLERGMDWLATIRGELGVPVTTDIHLPEQAADVSRSVDMLQIPAFLCRQTDLLVQAGVAAKEHRLAVNVKKGQFLSPSEMRGPVKKLAEAGCRNVLLTERGTFFGYHRLVSDFVGVGDLMELDVEGGAPPVCFDVTHSTQLPGISDKSGGRPERAPLLAKAAVAAGVHAVFIEAHPDPKTATSDADTQLQFEDVPALLQQLAKIRAAVS